MKTTRKRVVVDGQKFVDTTRGDLVLVITRKEKGKPRQWWCLTGGTWAAKLWGWLDAPTYAVKWKPTKGYAAQAEATAEAMRGRYAGEIEVAFMTIITTTREAA